MKLNLFLLLLLTICPAAFSQAKVYAFTEVSTRDSNSEWVPQPSKKLRTAQITDEHIELKLERHYELDILSTTYLPDKGVVYVCNDQQKARVTVMLIDDAKMFVYDDHNRYLIKLLPRKASKDRLYARNTR